MTFALAAAGIALAAPTAEASPTGYWKLFVSIDYASEGTVTANDCEKRLTDREVEEQRERELTTGIRETTPRFSLTAAATERISVRTVRPATIEVHVAPNGIGVVQQHTYAPKMRTRVTTGGNSGLGGDGDPPGCHPWGGSEPPPSACEPQSRVGGVYVSPLGAIGRLRGFTVDQEAEAGGGDCPMTLAQQRLPVDLGLEVEAAKKRLLSHSIPKIVLRKAKRFEANAKGEGSVSSASASLHYTVKLVRTGRPGS